MIIFNHFCLNEKMQIMTREHIIEEWKIPDRFLNDQEIDKKRLRKYGLDCFWKELAYLEDDAKKCLKLVIDENTVDEVLWCSHYFLFCNSLRRGNISDAKIHYKSLFPLYGDTFREIQCNVNNHQLFYKILDSIS